MVWICTDRNQIGGKCTLLKCNDKIIIIYQNLACFFFAFSPTRGAQSVFVIFTIMWLCLCFFAPTTANRSDRSVRILRHQLHPATTTTTMYTAWLGKYAVVYSFLSYFLPFSQIWLQAYFFFGSPFLQTMPHIHAQAIHSCTMQTIEQSTQRKKHGELKTIKLIEMPFPFIVISAR